MALDLRTNKESFEEISGQLALIVADSNRTLAMIPQKKCEPAFEQFLRVVVAGMLHNARTKSAVRIFQHRL